jgi:peptidyl-dipeptidase A
LALSVQTPKHLNKIKLIPSLPKDLTQINLKFQLRMALEKIAFMPFGYLVDKWRWDVFSGKVPKKYMNRHWWRLRIKYQGVSPPVKRTEKDFDPGAKYHIPSGDEYIRFLFILFSFYFF